MSEFRWVSIDDKDALERFYQSIITSIKVAAKSGGYALAVHGSMRRDLDLIAVPWVLEAVDKDLLARKIHRAACGLESQSYQWEEKPHGRMATCFPICFPIWRTGEKSLGHIDLSVIEKPAPQEKPNGSDE